MIYIYYQYKAHKSWYVALTTYQRIDSNKHLNVYHSQSVTNLITLGHTALSVYDNVELFYTVQEYIMKTKRF